jgi:integrase
MAASKVRKRDRLDPRKVSIKGKPFWQVNLGSQVLDGKRHRLRKTFASREEALAYAQLRKVEKINYGTAGISLSDMARSEAVEASRLLAPYNASILDAVREYIARRELTSRSETVGNAVQAFLAAKSHDGMRPRYMADLRFRLGRFVVSFGNRKVADIEASEIYAWLQGLGQSALSRNTYHLRLNILFEYCRTRGWVRDNPVKSVPRAKVSTEGRIGILSPEQIARLLEAADFETLPYWAIGAFSGLRSAELRRLEWSDIHWDSLLLEVPSLKSKTASRRFVTIRPNLAAWLEPYRERSGLVCPNRLHSKLRADRRAAGIATWPSNALRHSFASYHLAHFRDPRELALELGHSRSEVTFRHYRELVKPSEGEKFWKIAPALEGERKLNVVA